MQSEMYRQRTATGCPAIAISSCPATAASSGAPSRFKIALPSMRAGTGRTRRSAFKIKCDRCQWLLCRLQSMWPYAGTERVTDTQNLLFCIELARPSLEGSCASAPHRNARVHGNCLACEATQLDLLTL